jgi:hypothetical protein
MAATNEPWQAPIICAGCNRSAGRRRGWRCAVLLLLPLSLTVVAGGCAPSPAADRRLHMRTDRMQYTVNTWAKSEQGRPAHLQRSLDFVPYVVQRDTRRLKAAGEWFIDWQGRDIKRFQDRGPVYLDKTGRVLWGKPEGIEPSAIMFF